MARDDMRTVRRWILMKKEGLRITHLAWRLPRTPLVDMLLCCQESSPQTPPSYLTTANISSLIIANMSPATPIPLSDPQRDLLTNLAIRSLQHQHRLVAIITSATMMTITPVDITNIPPTFKNRRILLVHTAQSTLNDIRIERHILNRQEVHTRSILLQDRLLLSKRDIRLEDPYHPHVSDP